jgi:hypothetical protein
MSKALALLLLASVALGVKINFEDSKIISGPVKELPKYGPLATKSYSGYIQVDKTYGRRIH